MSGTVDSSVVIKKLRQHTQSSGTAARCDALDGRGKLVELSGALVQSQNTVAELRLELSTLHLTEPTGKDPVSVLHVSSK